MKLGARIPAAFFTFTRPAGPCLRARSDARYEGISSTRAGELLRCVHGTSWPPGAWRGVAAVCALNERM